MALAERPGKFGDRAVLTEGDLESAVSVLVVDLYALYKKMRSVTVK
jgi:hypothetical protein